MIHNISTRIFPLGLAVLVMACSAPNKVSQTECEAKGNLQPICEFSNPEDIVLLPDGQNLIVSEYGSYLDAKPGSLAIHALQSNQTYRLAPLDKLTAPTWGQADCLTPPGDKLSPHGIDLSMRPDGSLQLLVVNHYPEERIEFVELIQTDHEYQAQWRGCVVAPENAFINSVASTPEGGFVMTHMFPKDSPTFGTTSLATALSALGKPSGYVLEWDSATNQFSELESTAGGFPNGILVSPDGQSLYVAYSTGNKVVKFDRQTNLPEGEVKIAHPDNLRWDAQGNILVAGMPVSGLEAILCQEAARKGDQCAGAFEVNAINPISMSSKRIFSHDGSPPMGTATVAVSANGSIYIGSFAGNRILRVDK